MRQESCGRSIFFLGSTVLGENVSVYVLDKSRLPLLPVDHEVPIAQMRDLIVTQSED